MSKNTAAPSRFTKAKLLAELRRREEYIQSQHGFDQGNGCAQLWKRGDTDEIKERIAKAVEYGRWRAMQEIQEDVENGYIADQP